MRSACILSISRLAPTQSPALARVFAPVWLCRKRNSPPSATKRGSGFISHSVSMMQCAERDPGGALDHGITTHNAIRSEPTCRIIA